VSNDVTTEFLGYDDYHLKVNIVKYRKVSQNKKEFFQLVFDKTPFYPEGGGQVGDQGFISTNDEKIEIFNTKKENNLIIHLTEKLPTSIDSTFEAQINVSNRINTAKNHSATHLLHEALRSVLGDHVEQKGSLVNSNYLRFDFSHFSKVTDEELKQIEDLVNQEIQAKIALNEKRNTPIEEAKAMGAKALFGEKYGDDVRVIQFGNSIELCGGCHVSNTSDISVFKITTETAVAAGIRRIEAITGETAINYFKEKEALLDEISDLLKNPKDIVKQIADTLANNQKLTKEIEKFQAEKAKNIKTSLKDKIETIGNISFLGESVDLDGGSIKDILFQLKGEQENFVGVLGGKDDDKCTLSIIISESVVSDLKLDAGKMIREVSKHIQGGGGGQAFFATAGGKNAQGLPLAIAEIKEKMNVN
jgi:alanyl-tRNA synthetase